MPRKKKETLVHLDMAELTKTPNKENEIPKDQILGDVLANARRKKHLEIEDISSSLCIKPIYIEALEKGHYYVFPARAYTVGFLRTYAQFLKLDTEEVLQLFYQETSDTKEEPMDMLVIEKKMALPSKKTLAIVTGLFIAFYVIWYLIAKTYSPQTLIEGSLPQIEEKQVSISQPTNEEPVIEDIKNCGGMVQINASSVVGKLGGYIKKFVLKLIKFGLVDFVASDIHSFRENDMLKAYNLIKKKFKEQVANDLFINHQQQILFSGKFDIK